MNTKIIATAAALALLAGGVLAHDAGEASGSLGERLARIEKTLERLEANISRHGTGSMAQGCPMMGGHGMMGGMMGSAPNSQWRPAPGER